jgi:ribosomal protein S18 acetylase RimI-like enzyme
VSGVTIRLLGPDDLRHFKSIRLEALEREPDAFASTAEQWGALPDAEWLRRMVESPVFVAFRDGESVGIMGLLQEAPVKRRHRATIIMVYVRPDERGTGLAGQLLDMATKHARKLGVTQLELGVNADNEGAIGFYQRAGFTPFGRIPNASLVHGEAHDELLMVREIAD